MANHVDVDRVAQAFERTGCGWVLKRDDRDELLAWAARELDEFMAGYTREFGEAPNPDPFSLLDENPSEAAAFFQTFAGPPLSPRMRITIWRIVTGADIVAFRFDYRRNDGRESRNSDGSIPFFHSDFDLSIITKFGYEEIPYICDSRRPEDLRIIRNVGVLIFGDIPILAGYLADRRP